MSHPWISDCLALLESGPCVLVTHRQLKGSAPRESGARMVVTDTELRGSIGGGNLEHQAISTARELLASHRENAKQLPSHPGNAEQLPGHPGNAKGVIRDPPANHDRGSRPPSNGAAMTNSTGTLEPYGLGPALNQCCGGSVELLFEIIESPAPDWLTKLDAALVHGDHAVLVTPVSGQNKPHHVALPVGRGSELPEALQPEVRKMLDGTSDQAFQKIEDWWLQRIETSRTPVWLFGAGHVGKAVVKALADLPFEVNWLDGREDEFPDQWPDNVSRTISKDLATEVAKAAPETIFIVMTHSHELDEDLCHAVLKRDDFAFLGMIGSVSKRRRFAHRLEKRGIEPGKIERLVCPIGIPGIEGKEPATIALSLAAQLMMKDGIRDQQG
ncbi:MAG TPA: xanthine dehydrogenase accessory protein XdhC [Xanthomonadales bacterium]|nr:xanthine dehydrogenase accessory protein XdhC [Xanthomonadales bacterium]